MNNRYKVGQDRYGTGAFQPILDDNITKDNPVRAIDAYVDALDMVEMGFTNTCLSSPTGQPPYHPKLLMKIYMYGYINKVRSSRKLYRSHHLDGNALLDALHLILYRSHHLDGNALLDALHLILKIS